MARTTSLKESTRAKGQARIDQQKIDRFRAADPSSALRDDEILNMKTKKKKKRPIRTDKVQTIGDVGDLFKRRARQRANFK